MNSVIEAIKTRKLSIGSWIQTGSPTVAEVLSCLDYDWIVIDCEHTDIDITGFTSTIRAMYGRKSLPFIRVRENNLLAIRQALDMGARGVIVPLVNNEKEARKAVSAAKYPPDGVRGFCFSRMNDWGAEFEGYARSANDSIAVIVMIESKEAVENIEEILSVPGVDGVFIGPYDMSGSYGCLGQTDHRLILQARKTISEACKRHNKSAGIHVVIPTRENVKAVRDEGYTFLALGVDIVFLREAAQRARKLI